MPFLFLFLLAFCSFAQPPAKDLQLEIGKAHAALNDIYSSDLLKLEDNRYLQIKRTFSPNDKVFISIYDESLKFIKEKGIEPRRTNKKMQYQGAFSYQDEIYFLTSLLNTSGTKSSLYTQKLNKKSLNLGTPQKILTVSHEHGIEKNASYFVNTSPDQSKILVGCEDRDEKTDHATYTVVVLDPLFEELWRKELTFPHPAKTVKSYPKIYEVDQQLIDNKGNVYLLNYLNRLLPNLYFHKDYELVTVSAEEEKYQRYPIELGGLQIHKMNVAFDSEQNIIGGGFYTNKTKRQSSILGSFMIHFQKGQQELSFVKHHDFDAAIVLQDLKPSKAKKIQKKVADGKKPNFVELICRRTFSKKEGGMVLVGEIKTSSSPSSAGSDDQYDAIIVIDYSPTGAPNWTRKISKKQYNESNANIFYGFSSALIGEHLYLLFNDYKGNTAIPEVYERTKFRHRFIAEVVLVHIDPSGQVIQKVISPEQENRLIIQPHDCSLLENGEWLIYLERKKENFLGRLPLSE